MACHGNNATPPGPAVAPGVERIDAAAVARAHRMDPRVTGCVPGFDAPFFQAGLAGYSDAAMRIIARRHGCPYCVTEALLDRTLLAGGRGFAKADLGELEDNIPGGAEDQPLAGQIMGSEPDEMAAAAVKMVEQASRGDRHYKALAYGVWNPPALPVARGARTPERGSAAAPDEGPRFAAIDVNLACPVKKIRSKARGGHWLCEPAGAIEILREVRTALGPRILATVKLRRGSDDSAEAERNFFRVFDAAYELGYAWATVHGRTVEQRYVGPSRWTFLRDLVAARPDRVIFGSGDVWSAEDVFRMLAYTGVRGVSVARGCIGNPWIFRQARDLLAGREPLSPTIVEQRTVLEEHFALSVALHGENLAGRLMRKFGIRFAAHHPRAEEVRVRFIAVETMADWRAVLAEWYGEEQAEPVSRSRTAAVSAAGGGSRDVPCGA